MGLFASGGRCAWLLLASILLRLVSSRRLTSPSLAESSAVVPGGEDVSEASLSDFGAALPEGTDVSQAVLGAIVKRLVEARSNEEVNRCEVTWEPLLVDGKVGPEGLVVVAVPPGEGDRPGLPIRVNLYSVLATRRWYCVLDPKDPIVNEPLRNIPSIHVLALSKLNGPLCPSLPAQPAAVRHAQPIVRPHVRGDPRFRPDLKRAVENCDVAGMRSILDGLSDEDVSARDAEDRSVLYGVSRRNCLSGAELLVSRMDNWSVGHQDRSGCTVLHEAALKGEHEIVQLLLDHMDYPSVHARVAMSWSSIDTALGFAVKFSWKQTLQNILARTRPAELRYQWPNGHTVLFEAVNDSPGTGDRIGRLNFDVKDRRAIIAMLLERMDDEAVLAPNWMGMNVLHEAAKRGDGESVEALLSGMSATAAQSRDARGWTALHYAANHGHADVLHSVLVAIPDDGFVVATNARGQTALHLAMMRKEGAAETVEDQLRLVRELLERMGRSSATAAYIAARDAQDKTALHAACSEVGSVYRRHYISTDFISHPVLTENVRVLLQYMDDEAVAAQDGEGFTALHHAARRGGLELVDDLLHRMDDTTVCARDRLQRTALHQAALGGNAEVVSHIMKRMRRSDITAQDVKGKTAVQLCSENFHPVSASRILARLFVQ